MFWLTAETEIIQIGKATNGRPSAKACKDTVGTGFGRDRLMLHDHPGLEQRRSKRTCCCGGGLGETQLLGQKTAYMTNVNPLDVRSLMKGACRTIEWCKRQPEYKHCQQNADKSGFFR